jgi:hypothetical protein
MAKQQRTLPARKDRGRARDETSLLIESAESLGRMIGALQRQLEEATRGLAKEKLRESTKKKSANIPRVRKSPRAQVRGSKNPR